MFLRPYRSADCGELARLFYETVHTVTAGDYTEEQRNAWAPEIPDLAQWDRSLLAHDALVAVEEGQIVGFGDMDETGYLDRLFVHKDYQRRGAASAICEGLERRCGADRFTVHASVTAKPFFLARGYRVVQEQEVLRNGVVLRNYRMEKGRV